MKRLSAVGTTVLAFIATVLSWPAAAETTICTQVTSIPWTISAPGIYCLGQDFNVALGSGNAIAINASNVTLDLNRHMLSNLGAGPTSYAYGIESAGQKNIVIKNGSIQGFYIGIGLFDSSPYTTTQGNVIEDIAADRNSIGMYVEGHGNLVLHNRVSQSGSIGILAIGPSNVIRSNEVTGTGVVSGYGNAIYGYSSTGLIVDHNWVSGVISTVSGPSAGIYLAYSSHAVIRDNNLDKADTTGSGYSRSCGVDFTSSSDIAVVSNAIAAFYYGINVPSDSSAQTTGNVVIGSSMPVVGTTPATTY